MDYNKHLKALDDFRKSLREMETIRNTLNTIIHEADSAIGDCRHKIELDYPTTRKERTAICKTIREYSIERRKAKNAEQVLNELFAFADNHKQLINELDNLYGKMKKAKESVEKEKTYKVRVLHNLFGDEINAKI